jgi:hypothetical protein
MNLYFELLLKLNLRETKQDKTKLESKDDL